MSSVHGFQFGSTTLPFDEPVAARRRRRKRGGDRHTSPASIEAFEQIKQRRVKLYSPILELIARNGPEPTLCLTARQILRTLKSKGVLPLSAERNQISPRLTELLLAGCLENPDYLKSVPGDSTASCWRITERGRLLIEHLQSRKQIS